MPSSTLEQLMYILGATDAEHDRLNRQGRLISKITRHFLEEIGLCPGMRVLDVGSGVGDVALLAARMVAPGGQVIGIDLDESALEQARHRASEKGIRNLQFHNCDFRNYESADLFDAVVGRCVLLHQQHPASALASVAKHVPSGGIVAFQEPWFSQAFSFPRAPLFEKVIGWLHSAVRGSGLDGDIGLKLPQMFASAGLRIPQLTFEMLVNCSAHSEIYEFVADTARSLMPKLDQLTTVAVGTVQIETLANRLRQEQASLGSVVGVMPLMGAWCRKP